MVVKRCVTSGMSGNTSLLPKTKIYVDTMIAVLVFFHEFIWQKWKRACRISTRVTRTNVENWWKNEILALKKPAAGVRGTSPKTTYSGAFCRYHGKICTRYCLVFFPQIYSTQANAEIFFLMKKFEHPGAIVCKGGGGEWTRSWKHFHRVQIYSLHLLQFEFNFLYQVFFKSNVISQTSIMST